MTARTLKVSVTEKYRIEKYAEGATPGVDEPYEVVKRERTLEGKEAEECLVKLGIRPKEVKVDATN